MKNKSVFGCFINDEYHLYNFRIQRYNTGNLNLFCFYCNRRACSHCRTASYQEIESIEIPTIDNQTSHKVPPRHLLYSKLHYPYDYGFADSANTSSKRYVQDEIISRNLYGQKYFEMQFPDKIIKPESLQCCPYPNLIEKVKNKAYLLTPGVLITGYSVSSTRCTVCEKVFNYDGLMQGILNYDNKYLLCSEMFYDLLDMKMRAGLPTHSWWIGQTEKYMKQFLYSNRISVRYCYTSNNYNRATLESLSGAMNHMFTEFLKILDYPKSMMSCCQGNPDIIALDGICMSIEQKRLKEARLKQPWIRGSNNSRKSTRKNRNVVLLNDEERNIIHKLCSNDPLDRAQMAEVTSLYRSHSANPIFKLMKLSIVQKIGFVTVHPKLKMFFASIRKPISPAIQILPKVIWLPLEEFLETRQFYNFVM